MSHNNQWSSTSSVSAHPRFEGFLKPGVVCSSPHELLCCEFNPGGTLLAAGTTSGAVIVFQPSTGKAVYQLHSPQFDHLPVTAVRFMKDSGKKENILLAAYSSGHVRHWHVSAGQCLSSIEESRQTLAAATAPDDLTFATAGSDGKVLVYDESTMKLVRTLESSMSAPVMDGHASRVFALVYHPSDPRVILSAGWDDTVQFWDTRERHSVRKISGPHICGEGLDIEPTTLSIVTASWRYKEALQVWDFASGKQLCTLQADLKSKLYGVCWMNRETLLAGGTQNHLALVVNTTTDKVIGAVSELEHGVYCVDYCPAVGAVAVTTGTKLHVAVPASRLPVFITQED